MPHPYDLQFRPDAERTIKAAILGSVAEKLDAGIK